MSGGFQPPILLDGGSETAAPWFSSHCLAVQLFDSKSASEASRASGLKQRRVTVSLQGAVPSQPPILFKRGSGDRRLLRAPCSLLLALSTAPSIRERISLVGCQRR